jgi:hypothetical protein
LTIDAVEKAVMDSMPKGTERLNMKAPMKGYEFGRNLVKAAQTPQKAAARFGWSPLGRGTRESGRETRASEGMPSRGTSITGRAPGP